jgi:GMP reductase
MKIENDLKYDFSDVLIRPKRSTLKSRNDVNLKREFKFPHSPQTLKCVPIIASNMDTVGTLSMNESLKNYNTLTCLHKFLDVNDYPNNDTEDNNYIVSIGIRDEDLEKITKLYYSDPKKCNLICIDVANGYMQKLVEFCQKVRELIPHCILIAGNVVTREMTEELIINGRVDIVKVGIGSGSVCTTRLQTGVGMPQLSAIIECADAAHGVGGHIISDGGITCPGDCSKAFGAGADFVMLGSMLAGHEESGGELVEENGESFKVFYGMSSDTAMNKHYGGVNKYRSSEGKTVKVKFKGPVSNTVDDLLGGIRSTCTYVNATQISHLPKCTTFVRVNHQVNRIYG